jgi:Cu/Ag efflux pump CusA
LVVLTDKTLHTKNYSPSQDPPRDFEVLPREGLSVHVMRSVLLHFGARRQTNLQQPARLPDPLTGLNNRQHLREQLSTMLALHTEPASVALLLIAFVLFLTFGSFKQTLIILSNIPFALTGGLIALWLTGEFISVPASVGFIALLGIAVLNGVVMMSHFNYLAAKGLALGQVVREGALRRLRPVMMTASTCAMGLVPLLLATGPGSEIQKPLAIVVVGGLISSTLLTLFLLPIIYRRFHRVAGQAE